MTPTRAGKRGTMVETQNTCSYGWRSLLFIFIPFFNPFLYTFSSHRLLSLVKVKKCYILQRWFFLLVPSSFPLGYAYIAPVFFCFLVLISFLMFSVEFGLVSFFYIFYHAVYGLGLVVWFGRARSFAFACFVPSPSPSPFL